MTNWPVHAAWKGPIVMIGFGSIGRGALPLILRHIECDPKQITVIDPDATHSQLAEKQGAAFLKAAVTRKNFRQLLKPLLTAGPGPAFIVNLSVDVDSLDIMRLARETHALYIDTVIEPWPGFYYNTRVPQGERTNYAMREKMLDLKRALGPGPTAVSCCGANPGMVSWFVKRALMDIARATKTKAAEPTTRDGWARLMMKLGIKGIHIAERDTQRSRQPKPFGAFVNTWSVEGFISEGLQPAELGWGTHEKKLPPKGKRHKTGCGAAIYIETPGADTRVRTWTPTEGPHFGFLVTHNEAISISDHFTVRSGRKVTYRPTCHYAYHPSNDAVLSWIEMLGNGGKHPKNAYVLDEAQIADGRDELGVLLYGHKKNAYWYGSQLSIEEARTLAPYQSATGLQVTSAVLSGMIWAIENPMAGIVETDEMDYKRCLEIQSPYLGPMRGVFTGWTPLDSAVELFATGLDRKDPWQFQNILVR
ncbi:saccharopine dehydrogenase C-terminal domain-containing protein [Aestuariivirga sp.]|uniref:homospermidine synthase n=1 Tax=Aestuariivirga sp. TaxID=2650926 RepID=UPI0025B8374E|nr:saccharopine dehydrogenase C-terminal domain-containing protein [Aestuariivirga sp.]MCA3554517.1 homospermidine synthase [Aestuariivirga sp.]